MVKEKQCPIVWRHVRDSEKEAPYGLIAPLKEARRCCETPNLKFRVVDVSPVTDIFYVVCKTCGEESTRTSWSWDEAVKRWNDKTLEKK